MASYQVGDICYPTIEAGVLAQAARFVLAPQLLSAGCTGVPVASAAGPNLSISWVRVSGSCTLPAGTLFAPPMPQCQQYGISDAASLSWQVGACWIAVFAVAVILKRALQ